MDFLNYKYKPTTFDDIHYNESTKQKLITLSNNQTMTNLILYGPSGTGKKTLLNLYLYHYFNKDNSIYNLKTFDYTLSNNYKVIYKTSPKHFHIYFTSNPKNNILIIYELIDSLLTTKSVLNSHTIVLIHNIEKLQNNLIHLKYISEKYTYATFLCTSDKFISISIPFIQIRTPKLNYFDLLKITLKINKKEKLNIKNADIKYIIYNSLNNINNLLNTLQSIKNNQQILNLEEHQDQTLLNNIIKLLKKNNISDFHEIKSNINILLICKSYSFDFIIQFIFNNMIQHIKQDNKYNFIQETAKITENIVINNDIKPIIGIDTYIFLCYKML